MQGDDVNKKVWADDVVGNNQFALYCKSCGCKACEASPHQEMSAADLEALKALATFVAEGIIEKAKYGKERK